MTDLDEALVRAGRYLRRGGGVRWEAQQTDYPSAGPDRPDPRASGRATSPAGAREDTKDLT